MMWDQIASNRRKSVVLVVLMAALLFVLGWVSGEMLAPGGGGLVGLFVAFLLWAALSLVAYYQGSAIFLGISRAKKISREDHPRLWNVVEEMKIASGLAAMPDVYIIDDPSPNAFATGRSPEQCAVAATTGLLKVLDRNELQGVMAHEVAHIQNRDVLLMIMLGVMLGTVVLISDVVVRAFIWGGAGRSRRSSSSSGGGQAQVIIMIVGLVLMILAPILARLIYFAVSRKREYLADACAAQFTRYPAGLASALETISRPGPTLQSATRATAPMYIINPLHKKGMAAHNLSATHPPIQERVRILRAMDGAGYDAYDRAYRGVTHRTGVIAKDTVLGAVPTEIASPVDTPDDVTTPRDRAREAGDALLRLNDYLFLSCMCGNRLKIPPEAQFDRVKCPTCGRRHEVA